MTTSREGLTRRGLLAASLLAVSGCSSAPYIRSGRPSNAPVVSPAALPVDPEYVRRFSTGNDAYVYRGGVPMYTEFIGRASIETATNYRARDRFTVGGRGAPVPGGSGKERAEYACVRHVTYGTDLWVSLQVKFADFIPDTWFLFSQFHDVPDPGEVIIRPPVAFQLVERSKGMQVFARSAPTRHRRSTADEHTTLIYELDELTRLTWHHFVFRVRFARTGLGRFDLWHDGRQVYGKDIPVGYNDEGAPYFKYGTYRGATSGIASAEFATVEISTESLQHRVGRPLAIEPMRDEDPREGA